MDKNVQNPADGKYVVIENNTRVTKPLDTQAEAQTEAQRRNKLAEAQGQPGGGTAKVVQNLFG